MIAITRDPCDIALSARAQVLSIISKRLVRKSLDMFADIQKDEEKYTTFLQNFGRYLKVGLIEDKDNKDALLKLASFASSGSTARKHLSSARLHAGGRWPSRRRWSV